MYRRKYRAKYSLYNNLAEFNFIRNSISRLRKIRVPNPLKVNPSVPSTISYVQNAIDTKTPLQPKALRSAVSNDFKRQPLRILGTAKKVDSLIDNVARSRGYTKGGITRRVIRRSFRPLKKWAINEGIPATGGLLGSIAGERAGGLGGRLAGDYIGQYATRRALEDGGSLIRNTRRVLYSPTYNNMNPFKKARIIQKRVVRDAVNKYTKDSPVLGDLTGWGVGNLGGTVTPGVGGGAAIAMATGQDIAKGIKETQKYPLNKAIKRTGRRLKRRLNLKRAIDKGWEREAKAVNSINKYLGLSE